jgi:CBS domain-containing protein
MEAWQHKISDSLKITIGLFCFDTFSLTPLLNYITKKYKIKPEDIKQMRLSSSFVVQTEKETIKIPISEVKEQIMPSCRTCTDFSAELADISVGGAYPLNDWSVVIIRTKAGEDFFYDAVENGLISTWVIEQEPKVFERVIVAAMQKRTNALKEAKALEQVYGFLPSMMLRESEALAKIKVKDIMTQKVNTVPEDLTINAFLDLVAKRHHIAYPVINKAGEPFAVATLEEAAKVPQEARKDTLINKIGLIELVAAYPEETALDAFKKMEKHEVGRVLVLDPECPSKILGIVTKSDLMHILTNSVEPDQKS